jgi:hypothetical protein
VTALLDIVVGADRDWFNLILRPNNMFQRRTEFGGKLPVGNENKAYHRITWRAPPFSMSMGAARSLCNHDHPRAKRKGGISGGWLQNDVTKLLMLQSHRFCPRNVVDTTTGALTSGALTPGTACDSRQHQRKGIAAGADRQPSNGDTGNVRLRLGSIGQPRRRGDVEIDDRRNNRHRLVLQLLNSEAAYLQKTSQGWWRPCDQPAMNDFDMNAVIGHETRKDQLAAGRSLDEAEHQARLARAGRSTDEESVRPHQDR